MSEELAQLQVEPADLPSGEILLSPSAVQIAEAERDTVADVLASDAEIESARRFLVERLSEDDWAQVQEACEQYPQGFLVFRELLEGDKPTTLNSLLKASSAYKGSGHMFRVFEDFARRGLRAEGDDEEAVKERARSTNSIIFLAQTKPFYSGNEEIFDLLVKIAETIDVSKFLPELYKSDGNQWSIVLTCLRAAHDAKMPEAEVAFREWFNESRTNPLSR